MPGIPLRRFVVGLKARYHLWSGRRAYRVGAFSDAWAHYHKVIEHGVESFEANLSLGKIYLHRRDFRQAGKFLRRAQGIDPRRYLLQGFPEDFLKRIQDEASPVGRLEYRISITLSGGQQQRTPEPVAPLGDFSSKDEMLRHRGQPPLDPGEWNEVDWDTEARKLFEDE